MKTKFTLIATTNAQANKAVAHIEAVGFKFIETERAPENTVGAEFHFEYETTPENVAVFIDIINGDLAQAGIQASIGIRPTLETVSQDMVGKYIKVNQTGLIILAKITEVEKNQYGWNINFNYVSPGVIQWGESKFTGGSNFLRECDAYFQGSLVLID